MPLIKDIQNNLSKTLTQIEKLNLQIEKTISSSKTSIKNIKDVSSNIKELKVNNDKYNKAFEEFNLNQNQLSKKINKYLENPTPEKALKLKYQINVSNDYLTKATTVFSENKTSSDKVINSFYKYKNGDFISNAEQLIKFTSRLNPSFTKLINSVNKLKTKTQIKAKTKARTNTQTRKVYLHNETTPDPTCEAKKKELAAIMKIIDSLYDRTASNYFKMIELTILFKILKAKYDKIEAEERLKLNALDDIINVYTPLVDAYEEALERVKDDNKNSVLTILNLDLAQALEEGDVVKVGDILYNISSNTARINQNLDDFQQATLNVGTITEQTVKNLTDDWLAVLKRYNDESFKHGDELFEMNRIIHRCNSAIRIHRMEIQDYNEAIADGEKYIKEHCP